MNFRLRPWFLAATVGGVILVAACEKNAPSAEAPKPKAVAATVPLVKETERSKHFTAVNNQLEMGGTLYGYVDIEGDVARLMGGLQAMVAQYAKLQPELAPLAQRDLTKAITTLGLTDIKAIGASSVPDTDGYYRNRMFFYTGGERHGLLAGLGGKPGPFTHVSLAPANTAFYAETEIDVPAVYTAIKEVIAQSDKAAGIDVDGDLKKFSDKIALSVLDLIHGLKGHSSIVLRLDAEHPLRIPAPPQPVTIPGIALLISIDGVAPVLEPSFAKLPLKRSDLGGFHVYEIPGPGFEGLQPVLVVDGNTLHLATSLAFFRECREQRTGLAQNPEFQSALAAVGNEGNGLVYVSPKLFAEVRKIDALNPNLPPEAKTALNFFLGNIQASERPLIAIRSNLPDGILVRSHWDRSLKQELAMASVNPVTVGLLAAMAIPAFQKVRTSSQEKAVVNNLRQLEAAADMYYLEHGVQMATYDQLVGPTRFVKVINPVVGENYRTLRFVQGQPFRLQFPDGRVMTYPPGTVQPVQPQSQPPAKAAPKGR